MMAQPKSRAHDGTVGGGHRPQPGTPLDWPDGFGTRFSVFVDTEEEFDWSRPLDPASRDVTATAALPEAHRRLRDLGASPVYLVDYPIASTPAAIDAMREVLDDGGAVGTQLHPWVNPPSGEAVTPFNSFPGNLGPDIEAAKLDRLTGAIETAFGRRPLLYRAGRYGIGAATAGLLAERGYRIDSSMRSRYDYSTDGGPDFANIGNDAFWLDRDAGLAELPLTTVFTGHARGGGERLHRFLGRLPRGRGVFARTGLLSRVALTPEDMPVDEVLEAIRVAIGEGVRLLNLSFHSPSLVPGFTPYVRDAADLKRFYRWWDAVLGLFAREGVIAASQQVLIDALDSAPR